MPRPTDDPTAHAKERAWRELATIDEELSAGTIDEEEWHRRVLMIVEPAYLGAETPQGQSGHSGDAERWERARRLVLDAVDRNGTFLDIGCANGLLMESVAGWAAEDGRTLAPYGLDISAALSDLARERLPHWADRIWTGNAMSFDPPRRFTYVRTGLDYVPARRRAEYLAHLMTAYVEPDGRLIIGTYNEESGSESLCDEVARWGHVISGRSSRSHRVDGLSYKVFWIDQVAQQ
ncbi:class I SAM-dependent methyltransferase [Nocardioides silvaticus]|uniref:Class I SAM-dependent methyltransferase n=1 Tax=Nocardioides silvaticus TaxID=2201891 RepID=A0A316TX54_9ACTN|nr:methyltransferase domain-containing protein [Nocardioides silvaticus]PWN04206.1 class I SAM-dependent methyltransferase [Nocardioides silvaticus]